MPQRIRHEGRWAGRSTQNTIADYRTVTGTQHENVTTQTLLLSTARDPMLASLFNHASQAYNNDFFFKGIVLHDPHTSRLPASLADKLSTNFSSLEAFRSTFLNTAQAMFGPGYVWLVRTRDPNQMGNQVMRILTTYIAGSPLPGAHWRQQPADMNVHNNMSAAQAGLSPADYARHTQVQNTVGMAGQYSAMAQRDKQIAPGGADTLPLLCVSTWEHTWIRDWGMEGKRRFLEAWWDRINWEAVAHSLEKSGSR